MRWATSIIYRLCLQGVQQLLTGRQVVKPDHQISSNQYFYYTSTMPAGGGREHKDRKYPSNSLTS